jgi:hypothetical protein
VTFVEKTFFSGEVASRVFSEHTATIFCNQSIFITCTKHVTIMILDPNSEILAFMAVLRAGTDTTFAARMTLSNASILILEESWRQLTTGRVFFI